MINDRNAYTERELAHLVSIKIDESEMISMKSINSFS